MKKLAILITALLFVTTAMAGTIKVTNNSSNADNHKFSNHYEPASLLPENALWSYDLRTRWRGASKLALYNRSDQHCFEW